MQKMNLIETLRTLGAQMAKTLKGVNERKFVYEKYSDVEQFSVNTHVWFWRNNVTLQNLLLNATLAMMKPTPNDVGPTMQEWRSSSPTAGFITRCFMNAVVENRKAVTISEVEVETERLTGLHVSRDTVSKVLDDGVDLGLLEQVGNNSTYRYVGTDLFREECLTRSIYRYMQPEVRRFAEAVTLVHKMHDIAKVTRGRERDGLQYFDPKLSIQENISNGTYTSAANFLDELDESDLSELIGQMKDNLDETK